ncbi:hypothetical protein COCVIDRAFT_37240 [Bipolaris victoriae FI3]|uniref:Uncharacterized protein n=1 Tax=Bipolaris victoriae (strain FI3) TaxID=930091 RepID=W7EP02_BIPV3|nr:hypothetical protein COCVIDRAFT_37240 [Bipolaris victoriae FI3]
MITEEEREGNITHMTPRPKESGAPLQSRICRSATRKQLSSSCLSLAAGAPFCEISADPGTRLFSSGVIGFDGRH